MSELRDFGLMLAEQLPEWEFDEQHWAEYQHVARLVHSEIPEARMYLHDTWPRGRVEISGGYPDGIYIDTKQKIDITVNPARDIEAVTKDIQRRFLGKYLEMFHAMMEQVYQVAQSQARARDVADELAAILGCEVRYGRDAAEMWTRHGKVTVAAGTNEPYITIERLYSIPVEMAREVTAVMARYG